MTHPQRAPQWLAAVCERCRARVDPACPICLGKRYYFWDPESLFCFTPQCTPVTVRSAEGGERYLVRAARERIREENHLSTEAMLTFLGSWASARRGRGMRLWYEQRWCCTVWSAHRRAAARVFEDGDVHRCVQQCYDALLRRLARARARGTNDDP